jgi:hypothetical protein
MPDTITRNRREFVDHISLGYALWEAEMHEAGRHNLAPLDRAYAVGAGRHMVESGQYRAQTDRASIDPMWIDWERVAREARKALPRMRRMVADHG